jgi:hypothetical protein
MTDIQNSKLMLRWIDISNSIGVTNGKGYALTDKKTSVVFTNINLRNIIGVMYDEYDYFNIQLVQINQAGGAAAMSAADDAFYQLKMSGLPWYGCNYESTNTSSSSCIIGAGLVNYPTSAFLNNIAADAFSPCTFKKPLNETVDLTIGLYKLSDSNSLVAAGTGTYQINLVFTILPVDIDEIDKFDDSAERRRLNII